MVRLRVAHAAAHAGARTPGTTLSKPARSMTWSVCRPVLLPAKWYPLREHPFDANSAIPPCRDLPANTPDGLGAW